jgi:prefoldin subunit 5
MSQDPNIILSLTPTATPQDAINQITQFQTLINTLNQEMLQLNTYYASLRLTETTQNLTLYLAQIQTNTASIKAKIIVLNQAISNTIITNNLISLLN